MARYRWAQGQRHGTLPDVLRDNASDLKVGVFVSSEDEMTAIDDYKNPVYRDQLEALEAIVSHPWPTTTELFIRSHPNLRGLDNTQTRLINNAASLPQVTVIAPDSAVDSYSLVEACDVVVTFGSTVGIEAAYWNTPSVLVGRAIWEDLGVSRPRTHDEVIAAISTPEQSKIDALPYGHFQRSWGLHFDHYVPWPDETSQAARA